jgi:hypothetical protein
LQFTDFSPSKSPSLEQQWNALQKGLGRAALWAIEGHLAEDLLLDACVHDQRYDAQCEDNRGQWLWEILNSRGLTARFRAPILDALRCVSTGSDAEQICELVFQYAARGDNECRSQLHEFVERRPIEDSPWIGERQLLELGGADAFRFIARVRGKSLEAREWDWDDGGITDEAIEKLGEAAVNAVLDGSSDPAIGRFTAVWRQGALQRKRSSAWLTAEEWKAVAVNEILEEAYREDEMYRYRFRAWGRTANEADLEVVLNYLCEARDPLVIAKLLRVFSMRALPHFDRRLIDLCVHEDLDVRQRALVALENISHPAIRQFALEQLREPVRSSSVVGLFVLNFESGDEQRILESVQLPADSDDRHSILMDVTKVFEKNQNADCSKLAQIAYAETPCADCLFIAVKLLVAQNAAPGWLLAECRHDSLAECREFVERKRLIGEGAVHRDQDKSNP